MWDGGRGKSVCVGVTFRDFALYEFQAMCKMFVYGRYMTVAITKVRLILFFCFFRPISPWNDRSQPGSLTHDHDLAHFQKAREQTEKSETKNFLSLGRVPPPSHTHKCGSPLYNGSARQEPQQTLLPRLESATHTHQNIWCDTLHNPTRPPSVLVGAYSIAAMLLADHMRWQRHTQRPEPFRCYA
jgi:hypothetical protein